MFLKIFLSVQCDSNEKLRGNLMWAMSHFIAVLGVENYIGIKEEYDKFAKSYWNIFEAEKNA